MTEPTKKAEGEFSEFPAPPTRVTPAREEDDIGRLAAEILEQSSAPPAPKKPPTRREDDRAELEAALELTVALTAFTTWTRTIKALRTRRSRRLLNMVANAAKEQPEAARALAAALRSVVVAVAPEWVLRASGLHGRPTPDPLPRIPKRPADVDELVRQTLASNPKAARLVAAAFAQREQGRIERIGPEVPYVGLVERARSRLAQLRAEKCKP